MRVVVFIVLLPFLIPVAAVGVAFGFLVLVSCTFYALGEYAFEGTWENPWTMMTDTFSNLEDEE